MRLVTLHLLADSANEPHCVAAIEIAENFVRQVHAVDVPKALRRKWPLRIPKVLVFSLQKPPVKLNSLFGPRTVGAKQHAVVISQEKPTGTRRLTPQLGDAAGKAERKIRAFVQPFTNGRQVFGITRHMRGNKCGPRMSL